VVLDSRGQLDGHPLIFDAAIIPPEEEKLSMTEDAKTM
jgi:hypothetical protein